MPDRIDRIRAEIDARIRDLRPLVRELERLERAAAALARAGVRAVPGVRSRAGASPGAPPTATRADRPAAGKRGSRPAATKPKPRGAPRARGKAAPRGQTRAKVLDALAAAPASNTAAVAAAAGIAPNTAAATISRLVKQGRVRRLDDGGYAVAETASDAGANAAPTEGSDAGAAAGSRPAAARAPTPASGANRERRAAAPRRRARAAPGANRQAVLSVVRERPGVTAGEIAQATGIARSTVTTTLARLIDAAQVARTQLPGGGVGFRPAADATGEAPTTNLPPPGATDPADSADG